MGKGGKGGIDLANQVLEVIDQPQTFKHLYELEQPLEAKIEIIVKKFMVVQKLHLVIKRKNS